jgi:hypothetical protein
MLSIEYTHKRARLFRIELNFAVLLVLISIYMVWKILTTLIPFL